MNTTKIRTDILAMMEMQGLNTLTLAKKSGVEPSCLYNFLKGKASLNANSLLKLWPFVYEQPVPLAKDTSDAAQA